MDRPRRRSSVGLRFLIAATVLEVLQIVGYLVLRAAAEPPRWLAYPLSFAAGVYLLSSYVIVPATPVLALLALVLCVVAACRRRMTPRRSILAIAGSIGMLAGSLSTLRIMEALTSFVSGGR